jgi:hypothetical protein
MITSTWPSNVKGLCDGLVPRPRENTYYERKRIKNGTDQHNEDQQQTDKGLTIGHLECTITVQTRRLRITINELRKYKKRGGINRPHKHLRAMFITSILSSSLANNHEFGKAFLVDSINHMAINFTPINERLCVIRIKGRFSTNPSSTYMHQQMTQKRRPRINFMSSWSGHTQPAQVMT